MQAYDAGGHDPHLDIRISADLEHAVRGEPKRRERRWNVRMKCAKNMSASPFGVVVRSQPSPGLELRAQPPHPLTLPPRSAAAASAARGRPNASMRLKFESERTQGYFPDPPRSPDGGAALHTRSTRPHQAVRVHAPIGGLGPG